MCGSVIHRGGITTPFLKYVIARGFPPEDLY